MQPLPLADKPLQVLREIDLVRLRPDCAEPSDKKHGATLRSIAGVLNDYLATRIFPADRIAVIDGFLFLFNEPEFSRWHALSWWDQRKRILAIKDHHLYTGRALDLLARSQLAPFMGYSDDMVGRSTAREVKHAWMRKRLVLQECFWNAIDSISHAAYLQKKYQDMHPALCVLLCNVADGRGGTREMVLGIDNGTGFLYKKKSRDSAAFHLIYKAYKFFFKSGVFYIGGLELGLLETESRLSCHGSGAVVYQVW